LKAYDKNNVNVKEHKNAPFQESSVG